MTTKARRISRAATVWAVVLALMLYWMLEPYFPKEQLIEWLRSSQIIVSFIVVLVCTRSVYEILVARMPHEALQLVLGIAVAWTGAALNASWFLLWRMANYPEWMVKESPVNGFTIWVIVVGGFLHLTAPRSVEGQFPRENWIHINVVIVLSTALAIYVLTSPPDASNLAEALRPWLE